MVFVLHNYIFNRRSIYGFYGPCQMKSTVGTKKGADRAYKINTFCVSSQFYWACVHTLLIIFVFTNLQQNHSGKYTIYFCTQHPFLSAKNTSTTDISYKEYCLRHSKTNVKNLKIRQTLRLHIVKSALL